MGCRSSHFAGGCNHPTSELLSISLEMTTAACGWTRTHWLLVGHSDRTLEGFVKCFEREKLLLKRCSEVPRLDIASEVFVKSDISETWVNEWDWRVKSVALVGS